LIKHQEKISPKASDMSITLDSISSSRPEIVSPQPQQLALNILELLREIKKRENELIELAKRDYEDWGRKGEIKYDIRPGFLLDGVSCFITIDGPKIERIENDLFYEELELAILTI
jgi:hypothetical protein